MPNPLYDALFRPHEGCSRTFLSLKSGREISYADFLVLAARFAHVLRESGIKPGDRVALQAKKSPEALAVYAACVASGAAFLPLNTAYTPAEVDYFVSDSGAGLVVADGASQAALMPVAARNGARLLTLNGDGSGSLADAARAEQDT